MCSTLIAPTLALRTQACLALGGFAFALSSMTASTIHTQVSNTIATFLTTPPTPSKSQSPTKSSDPLILRTIKATMNQPEPDHPAQGPVWGLSVLSSFMVLLNARLYTDTKISRLIANLLIIGNRHKKSSVRGLTSIAWRCIIWAYMQPTLPVIEKEGLEGDEDSSRQLDKSKHAFFKLMVSMLEMQTGITIVGAILGDEEALVSEEPLRKALSVLEIMVLRDGRVSYDAAQTLTQLVSGVNGDADEFEPWDHNQLIPKALLTGSGTLFTCEFKNLLSAVRPIYEDLPNVVDVRPLTQVDLTKDWVIESLMTTWKSALGFIELGDEAEMPVRFFDAFNFSL